MTVFSIDSTTRKGERCGITYTKGFMSGPVYCNIQKKRINGLNVPCQSFENITFQKSLSTDYMSEGYCLARNYFVRKTRRGSLNRTDQTRPDQAPTISLAITVAAILYSML